MRFMTTLFCAKCAEAHRPKIRQHFIYFTDKDKTLEQYDHTDTHEYGMTPHTVVTRASNNDEVVIEVLCMMDDCGIKLYKTQEGEILYYGDTNKPVVENKGKYYTLDDKNEFIRYTGDMHLRAVVMRDHRTETISQADFKALLKMRL